MDDLLVDENLVVDRSALEVQQLQADGLGGEDADEVLCADAVLANEALEDVQALAGEHVNAAVLERAGAVVDGVLNEVSVHEYLAHALGHLPLHGECRRRRRCDNLGWVGWVWQAH